jgi:hypothetical protein
MLSQNDGRASHLFVAEGGVYERDKSRGNITAARTEVRRLEKRIIARLELNREADETKELRVWKAKQMASKKSMDEVFSKLVMGLGVVAYGQFRAAEGVVLDPDFLQKLSFVRPMAFEFDDSSFDEELVGGPCVPFFLHDEFLASDLEEFEWVAATEAETRTQDRIIAKLVPQLAAIKESGQLQLKFERKAEVKAVMADVLVKLQAGLEKAVHYRYQAAADSVLSGDLQGKLALETRTMFEWVDSSSDEELELERGAHGVRLLCDTAEATDETETGIERRVLATLVRELMGKQDADRLEMKAEFKAIKAKVLINIQTGVTLDVNSEFEDAVASVLDPDVQEKLKFKFTCYDEGNESGYDGDESGYED